jgi:hypothetical protein
VTQAPDGLALHRKRVSEVKDRAAKQLLNDEQRTKYADLKAKRIEYERKVDELEKQQPPAAAAAPAPAAAAPAGEAKGSGGDGLE